MRGVLGDFWFTGNDTVSASEGGTENDRVLIGRVEKIVKGTCRICDIDTLDAIEVWTIIRDRRRPRGRNRNGVGRLKR